VVKALNRVVKLKLKVAVSSLTAVVVLHCSCIILSFD